MFLFPDLEKPRYQRRFWYRHRFGKPLPALCQRRGRLLVVLRPLYRRDGLLVVRVQRMEFHRFVLSRPPSQITCGPRHRLRFSLLGSAFWQQSNQQRFSPVKQRTRLRLVLACIGWCVPSRYTSLIRQWPQRRLVLPFQPPM